MVETAPITLGKPEPNDMVTGDKDELLVPKNALPFVGTEPAILWITDATYDRIRDTWRKTVNKDVECMMCGYEGRARRVRKHARQHYTRHFCTCGFTSVDRDIVVEHRKEHSTT